MKKTLLYKRLICGLFSMLIFVLIQYNVLSKADELDIPEEEVIEEPYVVISSADCRVSITSGTATVTTQVEGKSGTIYTSVNVYLEKYTGSSWQSYASWTHSSGSELGSSDSTTVSHGTYRVRMTVYATGFLGSE